MSVTPYSFGLFVVLAGVCLTTLLSCSKKVEGGLSGKIVFVSSAHGRDQLGYVTFAPYKRSYIKPTGLPDNANLHNPRWLSDAEASVTVSHDLWPEAKRFRVNMRSAEAQELDSEDIQLENELNAVTLANSPDITTSTTRNQSIRVEFGDVLYQNTKYYDTWFFDSKYHNGPVEVALGPNGENIIFEKSTIWSAPKIYVINLKNKNVFTLSEGSDPDWQP